MYPVSNGGHGSSLGFQLGVFLRSLEIKSEWIHGTLVLRSLMFFYSADKAMLWQPLHRVDVFFLSLCLSFPVSHSLGIWIKLIRHFSTRPQLYSSGATFDLCYKYNSLICLIIVVCIQKSHVGLNKLNSDESGKKWFKQKLIKPFLSGLCPNWKWKNHISSFYKLNECHL